MTRDLRLTALAQFAWGLGEGVFIFFQPLYLQKWGASPLEIGGILGLSGLAATLTMAPAGYLADRFGPRRLMWLAWVLGTLAAVTMAAAQSLPVFVAGVVIYGLTAFVSAPMNSYITSVRGTWSVERTLTLNAAIYQFGAVAGPILGGFIGEKLGLSAIYRLSAALFLLSTLVIFFIRRPPVEDAAPGQAGPEQAKAPKPRPNLAANPRFMVLVVLISLTMFAMYLPQPLTANYLQNQQHLSPTAIGALGSFGNLGNALIMLFLGGLSAPLGLLAGLGLMSLFSLILWQGHSLLLFFAAYFFLGGYRLSRSMALAYARMLVKAGEVGFAYGLVETGNCVATILAPLAAGYLYSRDPQLVYMASLAAIGLMLIIHLLRFYKAHLTGRPSNAVDAYPITEGEQDAA